VKLDIDYPIIQGTGGRHYGHPGGPAALSLGAGLIHDILPAEAFIREIIDGARTLYKRLDPWA
jgi:hypothetical protein